MSFYVLINITSIVETKKADGRDSAGRFNKGNPGGPGNPHGAKVARLRSAFLEAVTADDVREVLAALVAEAKSGNVQAMREFFSRTLGPAEAVDLMQRVEVLEELLEGASGAARR